jgi:PhzF family phenazine biosynthesis protein
MKKLPDVYQIDAFTDQPFGGNSAGVLFSNSLSKEEMQLIAREMNVSETAFISKSSKADFKLRWFTPQVEVKLCGHATIASIHYLLERRIIKDRSQFSFETLSGILSCKTEDNRHFMNLPVPALEEFKEDKQAILKALSITGEMVADEFPFIITDKSYLFIYIKSLEELGKIKPDFGLLRKLTGQNNFFEAVTVFTTETFEPGNTAHLRFFAPYFGIDEDPVTGSANGPLLLVLRYLDFIDKKTDGKTFTFEQGDFIGRKGRVYVSYSDSENRLTISGKAVTVFKGEMSL